MLAPKSTHTLTTVEDTTYGYSGLPLVTSTITIAGHKSTIERGAGAPAFRLMAVSGAGKLTLEKLTLRGGTSEYGGGILNYGGSLILTECTVSGNTANFGGGVSNGANGTLTVTNSTISGNSARRRRRVQHLTLTNSTVSGNTISGPCGSVSCYGGGGVYNAALSPSRTAPSRAIRPARRRRRGQLWHPHPHEQHRLGQYGRPRRRRVYNASTLTLTNSTVSGNTASYYGGGRVQLAPSR